MKLLSFGEILYDVYPDKSCLGGAPLNLAAHASVQGTDAYVISAVGNDELGKKAIKFLKKLKINTKYIKTLSEKCTGKCLVTLDSDAIPHYNLIPDTAYDFIPYFTLEEHFDVFAFGTMAFRSDNNIKTVIELLKNNNFTEIYSDLNIRKPFSKKEGVLLCLNNATILKISDEELDFVCETVFDKKLTFEDSFKKIRDNFKQIKIIILTCGDKGSIAFDCRNGKTYSCSAVKTKVISTLGAGDSFGATFLVNYLRGESIDRCLEKASIVSAFVVSKVEAIPEDIYSFIKSNPLFISGTLK